MEHLVGSVEIAERLGLSDLRVVHVWRGRYPDFPDPVAKVSGTFVWNWPEVERWARQTGRYTGGAAR